MANFDIKFFYLSEFCPFNVYILTRLKLVVRKLFFDFACGLDEVECKFPAS